MSFTDGFRGNSNLTRTENGAVVKSTTGSALLNLFARVGGLRQASESEINRTKKELAFANSFFVALSLRHTGEGSPDTPSVAPLRSNYSVLRLRFE